MSSDFKITYTDNPYIDIIVYNTKMLGIDTILKMQDVADANETLESKRNADMLMACMENTATFELFGYFSKEVLMKAGLTGTSLMAALVDPERVPQSFRPAVVKAAKEEFIEKYTELNNYYRMLYGLPPIGYEDVYTDWEPPEGMVLDTSIPVHEMSYGAVAILARNGVLDDMYNEDRENRAYLKHILRKVEPYAARRAGRFGILYVPGIESTEIYNEYRERLAINRDFTLQTVYSEAFKYGSDYYDNFIAVFITLNTMCDIIARTNEFITRKEVFDIRTVRYIFESYGVDFFPEIPMKYQLRMVKNLHTLIKYKSTTKCMVDICSLFGFENIKIFKYYLLKSRKYNKVTKDYSFTGDNEQDFEMKFIRVPIDESLDAYIRDASAYADYDEITVGDPTWDGGLEHEEVKKDHLNMEYNYIRTKYLSVDSLYDIAKISIQQCYFFNMLYDNVRLETEINLSVPYISPNKLFNIADIFIFLTCITYQYRGVKDTIMDTQGKILTVYGFNFKADLAEIAANINQLGAKLEAIEAFKKFNIPDGSIPTMTQLMELFTNNLDVRDVLVEGMRNADNLKIYNVYKYLYDSLMTMELTMDYFMDPETGDFYRDTAGDATYTEYLLHKDPILYYKLIDIELMEDQDIRNQYIATLIDNVVYILENYIDTEEFNGLFHGLPVVSVDAVKQYIKTVIDFYKSYKVHFLGINTMYYYDDKNEGWVKIIDWALLNRWFEKDEIVPVVEKIFRMNVNMTKKDQLEIIEKVYLDIRTWKYMNPREVIKIKDRLGALISHLNPSEIIMLNDSYNIISQYDHFEFITLLDRISTSVNMFYTDRLSLLDTMWTFDTYTIEGITYFDIENVVLRTGMDTKFEHMLVNKQCTAVFVPDPSVYDIYDGSAVVTCDFRTVTITHTNTLPVIGTVKVTLIY